VVSSAHKREQLAGRLLHLEQPGRPWAGRLHTSRLWVVVARQCGWDREDPRRGLGGGGGRVWCADQREQIVVGMVVVG